MLDIKWKNNSAKGLLLVMICAMTASVIMCNAYPFFRGQAEKNIENYKKANGIDAEEQNLFYVEEDFMRYLLSAVYYMNYEATPDMDAYMYLTQDYDMNRMTKDEQEKVRRAASRLMKNMRNQYVSTQSINNYFSYASGVEKDYGTAANLRSAIYGNPEEARNIYQAGLVISYDGRGVPAIKDSWNLSVNEAELLRYLSMNYMSKLMEDNGLGYEYDGDYDEYVYEEDYEEEAAEVYIIDEVKVAEEAVGDYNTTDGMLLSQIPVPKIQNMSFAFGINSNVYMNEYEWQDYWFTRNAYTRSGYMVGVLAIVAVMAALALVLQNIPALGLRKNRLFCIPTELVAWAGCIGLALTVSFSQEFGVYTMAGEVVEDFSHIGFGDASGMAATVFIFLFWSVFAFCWYWLAASLLPYFTHPIRTVREQALCIGICKWGKNCWLKLWHWATDVELDEKLTRSIWKVVGLNGVVVAAFSCIWFGGVFGAVIYTIVLYVLIKQKCFKIQADYQKLLSVTRDIAAGELNTPMDEDMGLFNPIRNELSAIQSGFKKAVNEEVRSRNMKTELITNVSHDLKTPLTAIITYVDLLKKEDISEEDRKKYIDTLDKKSQRLKVLIEDLFEVSKASSDNIVMNYDDVDLGSLIKQVRLENEDKIAESTLDFRWNLPDEKCVLLLDPQRTFRVIDNLVQNILKYSMPHSRVYIDMREADGIVTISFKNMSAAEMNFSPGEITERFVRGDLSRNTEGSGLGLAIAQSFTELQGGTFQVDTDGDLFKVVISWKR